MFIALHAFSHQRLLLDVARDVLERRLVFTDEMPQTVLRGRGVQTCRQS